jgi:hypothetical protein
LDVILMEVVCWSLFNRSFFLGKGQAIIQKKKKIELNGGDDKSKILLNFIFQY